MYLKLGNSRYHARSFKEQQTLLCTASVVSGVKSMILNFHTFYSQATRSPCEENLGMRATSISNSSSVQDMFTVKVEYIDRSVWGTRDLSAQPYLGQKLARRWPY